MKQITHMHTWFAVVQFFAFKSDINDDGRLVFERKRSTIQQQQQQRICNINVTIENLFLPAVLI